MPDIFSELKRIKAKPKGGGRATQVQGSSVQYN